MEFSMLKSGIAVIGLTGQSGAGKTAVSDNLIKNGFSVINADEVARKIVKPDMPCLNEIKNMFGEGYILPDGNLNRKKLAHTVFTDKSKLELLNGITYPHITEEIIDQINIFASEGKKVVILDAPTLFESGVFRLCNKIISVISEEETRIKRIIKRDNITEKEAYERINSQYDDIFYTEKSDFIIKNGSSDTLDDLKRKTDEISEIIKECYGI